MSPVAIVCGHVTLDRRGADLVPGGSVYYAGHAYRALGVATRVLAGAGEDYPQSELDGLERRLVPAPCTTIFENKHDAQGRRTQRVEAVAPALAASDLPDAWLGADVLHLAPVIAEVDVAAFARAARAKLVGLGVQGMVRQVKLDGAVVQPLWQFAPEAMRGVDVAFLSEDDVVGQGNLVERLSLVVPLVVLTLGVKGCQLIERGRTRHVGIYPTKEVDPTGAGDVFAAGFLAGLAQGQGPVDAARLGAAAASIVVEGIGGATLPRIGEARRRAEQIAV
jgi:sugar/nucleoside kinase (ribokinase family)